MSGIQTKRWNQLRTCLANPLTPKSWNTLVACLREWPETEEKNTAFAYFYNAIGTIKDSKIVEGAPLTGLWKLVEVEEESGLVDTTNVTYFLGDVEELFDFHLPEAACGVEEKNALHFYLEIHSDGRYRELDLSLYPLPVKLSVWEEESLEEKELEDKLDVLGSLPLGSVWTISGYECSLSIEEEEFASCPYPKKLESAIELVIHNAHPAPIVEDRVLLNESGELERRGYVLRDGYTYTLRNLRYRRVACFR